MYRTHTCGCLRADDVNRTVTLAGWVQKVRNLGAMTFIDLRDRYGITQIVVEEHSPAEARETACKLGREWVVQVTGKVVERSSKNPKMATGDIEVAAEKVVVLHEAEVPPFTIEETSDGGDDLRMKYRYLDLRRPPLQRNMILRHKMAQEIRRFLDSEGFLEIETPYLVNSTPEGARDFVVPSRMSPNQFYALPQSPQQYKQLLMLSGFDRYFQIARCFRDEDLRADRQPEFTQIDLEMSFLDEEQIQTIQEGFLKRVFKEVLDVDVQTPFLRMPWREAMDRFGSDKPDMRFGFELQDISDLVKDCGARVWPVGRLDLDSEGLLLLTDDGALTNALLHPSQEVEKEYLVWVKGYRTGAEKGLERPMTLDGQALRPGPPAGPNGGAGQAFRHHPRGEKPPGPPDVRPLRTHRDPPQAGAGGKAPPGPGPGPRPVAPPDGSGDGAAGAGNLCARLRIFSCKMGKAAL